MSDPLPDDIPDGYKAMQISVADMDYMQQYWEIRDHGVLLAFAARLLCDLTKAEESSWRLCLVKTELDHQQGVMKINPDYSIAVVPLSEFIPTRDTYMRLSIASLEAKMKKTDESNPLDHRHE